MFIAPLYYSSFIIDHGREHVESPSWPLSEVNSHRPNLRQHKFRTLPNLFVDQQEFIGPQNYMSRIPVPSHSPPQSRNLGTSSPVPFPAERATSPLPQHPGRGASMSSLSGFQSNMSETRRKTSKRDEVGGSLKGLAFDVVSIITRHEV